MNRLVTTTDDQWGQLKAKIQKAEKDTQNNLEVLKSKLKAALNNRSIFIPKDSKEFSSYKNKR